MPLPYFEPITVNAVQPTRRRIIEFKLSEEVLEDILNGKDVLQLDMNQSKLLIGETQYNFTQAPGPFSNVEVYSYAPGSGTLNLVGDITAKCTIQRTHARKGQKKDTKYEHSRTTQIIDAKDLKKSTATSAPTIVPARRIRSASPTAPPSTAAVPLRTRVIQLLALQPRGIPDLKKMLKATQDDLQAILTMVATSMSGGKFKLKAETYKEVKIFDWNKYSAKEREVVAKNAEEAFDKLGLAPDAPERDKLNPDKVKQSPPLVAEGYHGVGGAGAGDLRWRTNGGGGGGSESEGGPENGRASSFAATAPASAPLKPPSARKKVSTKKTAASMSSSSGTISGSGAKRKSVSSKSGQMSAEQAAQSILEMVPNLSARALSGSAGSAGAPASTTTTTAAAASLPATTTTTTTTATSTAASAASATPKLGSASAGMMGGVTGRRSSLTGANGVTIKTSTGAEVKKSSASANRDTGGVGNGYRIPKASSAAARGKTLTTAMATSSPSSSTSSSLSSSPAITIPPIVSQREFEHVSRQFLLKHQELTILAQKIEERKQLLAEVGLQLEQAIGTDRENDLKRKAQEACGGEEVVNRKILRLNGEPRNGVSTEAAAAALAEQKSVQASSIKAMSDRYRVLHSELSAMKGALWKAGKGQAYSSAAATTGATVHATPSVTAVTAGGLASN